MLILALVSSGAPQNLPNPFLGSPAPPGEDFLEYSTPPNYERTSIYSLMMNEALPVGRCALAALARAVERRVSESISRQLANTLWAFVLSSQSYAALFAWSGS